MGRFDEASRELKQAQSLEPDSPIVGTTMGRQLYFRGQYDQAIDQLKKTLEMEPDFGPAHRALEAVYEQKGMYKEAIDDQQVWLTRSRQEDFVEPERAAYDTSGYRGLLKYRLEGMKLRPTSPYDVAQTYARLGERDQALEWLERAFQQRDSRLVFLKVGPAFESMRSDAKIPKLVRSLKFPP